MINKKGVSPAKVSVSEPTPKQRRPACSLEKRTWKCTPGGDTGGP